MQRLKNDKEISLLINMLYIRIHKEYSRIEFQWFPIDLFAQVKQRPFLIKISFIFIVRFVLTFSGIQALQLTFYRKHTAVPLGWVWCQKAKAKNKEKQKLTVATNVVISRVLTYYLYHYYAHHNPEHAQCYTFMLPRASVSTRNKRTWFDKGKYNTFYYLFI